MSFHTQWHFDADKCVCKLNTNGFKSNQMAVFKFNMWKFNSIQHFLAVGCAHTCGMSRNGFLNEKIL